MQPDDDYDHHHHKRRQEYQDEEEGRYDISWKPPPKKRRKVGRPEDAHTVFISDDEEDELDPTRVYSLDSEVEEVHYVSDGDDVEPEKLQKVAQRRSFWLSKGIGIEEDIDS